MIPVTLQAEPVDFDRKVRQPGRNWLASQGIALNSAPPKASDLPNYWTHSNYQLWEAYSGICAYLAIYFEWATGAASTDHFVAKSINAGAAYEWSNYRLSCLAPNRNKGKFDDVLDPFGLHPDTFVLNLLNGEIRPTPSLESPLKAAAQKTISRLKLDSVVHNRLRAKHYEIYLRKKDEETLKEYSPFVWYEAQRQGLL
ncbi:MAG: hypothetical protein ACT6FD_04940 [Methanosarcinaceae archaeon]